MSRFSRIIFTFIFLVVINVIVFFVCIEFFLFLLRYETSTMRSKSLSNCNEIRQDLLFYYYDIQAQTNYEDPMEIKISEKSESSQLIDLQNLDFLPPNGNADCISFFELYGLYIYPLGINEELKNNFINNKNNCVFWSNFFVNEIWNDQKNYNYFNKYILIFSLSCIVFPILFFTTWYWGNKMNVAPYRTLFFIFLINAFILCVGLKDGINVNSLITNGNSINNFFEICKRNQNSLANVFQNEKLSGLYPLDFLKKYKCNYDQDDLYFLNLDPGDHKPIEHAHYGNVFVAKEPIFSIPHLRITMSDVQFLFYLPASDHKILKKINPYLSYYPLGDNLYLGQYDTIVSGRNLLFYLSYLNVFAVLLNILFFIIFLTFLYKKYKSNDYTYK